MARYEEAIIDITKLLNMIAWVNNLDIIDAYFDSLDGQAGCQSDKCCKQIYRSMSRARDVCDQLVGLCEHAEVD
ncbi:hypothetical protein F8M41_011211 [Gigaspora margarita]|uniref:Uncharacterized protein n=1 Tax=Gigaspora margarita TaxID=4874 RepID=A0A8H4B438_GIGMA|nr:hypothetical protein F8M41_011211 [Gigaspora margarita]